MTLILDDKTEAEKSKIFIFLSFYVPKPILFLILWENSRTFMLLLNVATFEEDICIYNNNYY